MANVARPDCPILRPHLRRLRARAVLVSDASGVTRFDGDLAALEQQAQAYKPKGTPTWTYETRSGTQLPWPNMSDPAAIVGESANDDRVLYLVERMAELNARAYRDAYTQANALMSETLGAMQSALNALSNRAQAQEELIEELMRQRAEQGPGTPSEADKLVGSVLDLAVKQGSK